MYDKDANQNYPSICDLVPGFAAYNHAGYSLAENLVNLFEACAELIGNIKRNSCNENAVIPKQQGQSNRPTALVGRQEAV